MRAGFWANSLDSLGAAGLITNLTLYPLGVIAKSNTRFLLIHFVPPMKLIEALDLQKTMRARKGDVFRCFLASGINSLHLKTFLVAELALLFSRERIEVTEGLFGDLPGSIGALATCDLDFGIVVIEWSDLDPRLGIRNSARWSQESLADIAATVAARAQQIKQAITEASQRIPIALCLPTLPLLPFSHVPGWQAGQFEADLHLNVQALETALSQISRVRIVSRQRLDIESPFKDRFDAHSDLTSGFPYKLHLASILASHLAQLVRGPLPKKGIITDLDNTLWKGILGEDGVHGVSWDLDHGSQAYAFYQRFLGALASEGVIVGVASKNERSLVEEAFQRTDLALSPNAIFPVESHWEPKSTSVTRILSTWNVGPEAVVFVDDSPFELAEVQAAFPQMTCIQFPAGDDEAIYRLAFTLRDHFGKNNVHDEDLLRLDSIRRSHIAEANQLAPSNSVYIQSLQAEINCDFSKAPLDPRALDLVNKTNQFNLNGKRYTESSWSRLVSSPDHILLVASYSDKFGPLGKISVLLAKLSGKRLSVETWVMSCRAFSRQVENKCLAELLDKFNPEEIEFDYLQTERNKPLQDFLAQILGVSPGPKCVVTRAALEQRLETPSSLQEALGG
jgi:FkbH-like protein